MKNFLVGLFTHHVVTKIVSLLLAIVLFVFVQQSISETQRISKLVIHFELSTDLEKRYVLLEEDVVLQDITVSGLRESLTREMSGLNRAGFRIVKQINADFLKNHPTEREIVIDAAFCRQEGIPWQLGKDFDLRIERPRRLEIENRVNITVSPELTEEMARRLELPEGYKFVNAGGIVFDKPSTFALSGPPSALPENYSDDTVLPLYVTIDRLKDLLDNVDSVQQARESWTISGIDWERSGFKTDKLQFLKVEQPAGVSFQGFREQIRYSCLVEQRREAITIRVPLRFLTDAEGIDRRSLVDKVYVLEGPAGLGVFKPDPDPQFRTTAIPLEVVPEWRERQEDLAQYLALVVDLTGSKQGDEPIFAPIRLEALRDAPPGLLEEVRLARGKDAERAEFRFKKP